MADGEVSPDSYAPDSYASDDLPEDGLAADELEELRSKLKTERQEKLRSYAQSKLMIDFKLKIPGTDMTVELRVAKNGDN